MLFRLTCPSRMKTARKREERKERKDKEQKKVTKRNTQDITGPWGCNKGVLVSDITQSKSLVTTVMQGRATSQPKMMMRSTDLK